MGLFTRSSALVGADREGQAVASAPSPAGQSVAEAGRPATRDVRAQAVHRLQVGLFGLAGMLLLIGLANIIMDRAQETDQAAQNVASASASSAPSEAAAKDPLADMGVAPQLPAAEPAQPAAAPARGN